MLFFALNYLPCAFNSTEIIIITTLILGGFGRFFIYRDVMYVGFAGAKTGDCLQDNVLYLYR
jgi:hypothetical protein